jgi:hypothetical protein
MSVVRTFESHENGVYVHSNGADEWHGAAAPEDARKHYLDVLEQVPVYGRHPTTVQRIEMGKVVAETLLRAAWE